MSVEDAAHLHRIAPASAVQATSNANSSGVEFDDVRTVYVDDSWLAEKFGDGTPDAMANYVRLYNDDVDEMMGVLVPSARYRKGHYAYGKFTASPAAWPAYRP